jgi:sulfur carrier protein ThiS adenylyltransferase
MTKIILNGKETHVAAGSLHSLVQEQGITIGSPDWVVILNGFASPLDLPIADGSEVSLIERGVLPAQDQLEGLMASRHTPGVHKAVKKAYVAICGLGGLGSNIAIALARIGVGHLHLIDFDVVEPSNLNRQQYFISHLGLKKTDALKDLIQQINPFITVTTSDTKIEADNAGDLLKDADIICEAFDNPTYKALLTTAVLTDPQIKGKPYVGASGLAGYESSNTIQTKAVRKAGVGENGEIHGGVYIAGDAVTGAGPGRGLMAPRVLVAAGHQANMILRLIVGETGVNDE